MVISHDSSKFREVPREPLLKSHAEGINVLVHLLNEGNGLHDWLVLPVNISSALLSGVGMSQTKLSLFGIILVNFLQNLWQMSSNTSD